MLACLYRLPARILGAVAEQETACWRNPAVVSAACRWSTCLDNVATPGGLVVFESVFVNVCVIVYLCDFVCVC